MRNESEKRPDDWKMISGYLEKRSSRITELLENPKEWESEVSLNPFLLGEKQGPEAELVDSLALASKYYQEKKWKESRRTFEGVASSEFLSQRGKGLVHFVIAKTHENEGNYEMYREYARKSYDILKAGEVPKFTIPIGSPQDVRKVLGKEFGEFPLYGFFLFSTFDQDIITFLQEHASWLHNSSGEDVLLAMFENPEKWGRGWKEYWKQKLGPEFDKKYAEWSLLLPEDRDLAYSIANQLGIEKNILPCIVFVKSVEDKQILCIPIIQNKDNYRFYFEDLFTVIQEVRNIAPEDRLVVFQKKWKMVWAKWILPEKIKTYATAIQEWGSMIITTKNTILSIIEPVTPFIAPLKEIIAK
jgi:hypothetical protein